MNLRRRRVEARANQLHVSRGYRRWAIRRCYTWQPDIMLAAALEAVSTFHCWLCALLKGKLIFLWVFVCLFLLRCSIGSYSTAQSAVQIRNNTITIKPPFSTADGARNFHSRFLYGWVKWYCKPSLQDYQICASQTPFKKRNHIH